ncbi:hypothetical protein HRbin12_01088 [bacterium HR12]|nr:hypothetical protein HRbin12_01088 [bacterium HR12]
MFSPISENEGIVPSIVVMLGCVWRSSKIVGELKYARSISPVFRASASASSFLKTR